MVDRPLRIAAPGTEIEIRLIDLAGRRHHFDVVTAGGEHAIIDGYLESFGVDAGRPLHEGDERAEGARRT